MKFAAAVLTAIHHSVDINIIHLSGRERAADLWLFYLPTHRALPIAQSERRDSNIMQMFTYQHIGGINAAERNRFILRIAKDHERRGN